MRTSLRQNHGDKSHNSTNPRAFWEGCPSAACVSSCRGSVWPTAPRWHSIRAFHFLVVCFAPVTPLQLLLSFVNYSKQLFSYSFELWRTSATHPCACSITRFNMWLWIHLKPWSSLSTYSFNIVIDYTQTLYWVALTLVKDPRWETMQPHLYKVCTIYIQLNL